MSSSHRIRFNRSLFSTEKDGLELDVLVAQLAAEDIELILDMRVSDESERARFEALCADASIYYVARPELSERAPGTPPSTGLEKTEAWAAGLALRHRTCVLGDDRDLRLAVTHEIAEVAGQRVIDMLSSPARVAFPPSPEA
jgi:hypothetical protein